MLPRRVWCQTCLTVVLVILGILLALQFRTQRLLASSLEAQKTEDLVAMWKNSNAKRSQLVQEVNELEEQLQALTNTWGESDKAQVALEKELLRLKIALGLIPVKGPGITVSFTGDAPLLDTDLVDLVNELWVSGAEAIAINDHRVTPATFILDKEEGRSIYHTVNGQKLLYPIVIKAIGDPDTLEKGLTFTGGLIDNLSTLYNIRPDIKKHQEIKLPAAPPIRLKYGHPAKEEAASK
ncbi:Uncharacterized conserved protein YlxW, UPF0749 family [Thermanaeromonas toyohensis ToBE]|uniref:Uncharacterized conserved protein YlxW, UPF0749 family n=1 Tax=Thermanaeromonas toyohensis ToBE TaxID=698762 RepID=A0A1W1VCX4_9FIRM|nr:DUF881 domain-containing protein [Thermanaeromonas toyohensis]SMB90804.1 Uncharacterized conserved protein YlxW, UPF0749 family [Thermanaeromonas toyohensis ToBE]